MKVVLPTWFFFHNWNDTLKHERGVLNFYLQRFACTFFLIIPIWILNREFLHEDRGNNPPYQSTFVGFEQFSGFNNLWGIPTKFALSRLNFQSIVSLRSWLHCRGYQHIDFIIIWKLKIIISKHFQFDIKQNLTDTAWISYIIDEKDSK